MISEVTKSSTRVGSVAHKFVCLLGFLFLSHAAFSQQEYLDSLKSILKGRINDTTRLRTLYELICYAPQKDCFIYNKDMIRIAQKNLRQAKSGNTLQKRLLFFLAEGYYNEGVFYADKALPDSGMIFYQKSMEINRMLANYYDIACTEVEISKILTNQGNYPEAMELLYKALIHFEKTNNLEGMGDVYKGIGRVHYKLGNNDKSLNAFLKAYHLYEKIDQKSEMINTLFNIAVIYSTMNNYREAIIHVRKSIALQDQLGELAQEKEQELLNVSLGLMYSRKMQMDSAIPFFEKSIEIAIQSNNLVALGHRYLYLADAYNVKKQYKKALEYCRKALSTGRENNDLGVEQSAVDGLYKIYKNMGNYKSSLEMQELNMRLMDSLRHKEDKKQIIEKQFKYEYEKRELIAKGNEEKKINELKLDAKLKDTRKNEWIMGLSFAFIILSAGSWFLYNHYRQKNVIHIQKNNLLKQQLLLTQMNPHFIFNFLNAIQNFIMKQDSMQAGIYLSQFAGMIRMILDFSRRDYISLESELSFLNHYMELQQLRMDHAFVYNFEIGEGIEPEMLLVPPMLAQPFLENAIEHGGFRRKKKGEIRISFYRQGELLVYVIEDNGIGLKASVEQKEQSEKQHESLATRITLERMETLYHDRMNECRVMIEDKKDADPAVSGVKVTCIIPYKEV
jgi:tetratricopeptide (TPR) repeat protein